MGSSTSKSSFQTKPYNKSKRKQRGTYFGDFGSPEVLDNCILYLDFNSLKSMQLVNSKWNQISRPYLIKKSVAYLNFSVDFPKALSNYYTKTLADNTHFKIGRMEPGFLILSRKHWAQFYNCQSMDLDTREMVPILQNYGNLIESVRFNSTIFTGSNRLEHEVGLLGKIFPYLSNLSELEFSVVLSDERIINYDEIPKIIVPQVKKLSTKLYLTRKLEVIDVSMSNIKLDLAQAFLHMFPNTSDWSFEITHKYNDMSIPILQQIVDYPPNHYLKELKTIRFKVLVDSFACRVESFDPGYDACGWIWGYFLNILSRASQEILSLIHSLDIRITYLDQHKTSAETIPDCPELEDLLHIVSMHLKHLSLNFHERDEYWLGILGKIPLMPKLETLTINIPTGWERKNSNHIISWPLNYEEQFPNLKEFTIKSYSILNGNEMVKVFLSWDNCILKENILNHEMINWMMNTFMPISAIPFSNLKYFNCPCSPKLQKLFRQRKERIFYNLLI